MYASESVNEDVDFVETTHKDQHIASFVHICAVIVNRHGIT